MLNVFESLHVEDTIVEGMAAEAVLLISINHPAVRAREDRYLAQRIAETKKRENPALDN